MKKILGILLVLALAGSVFAQTAAAPAAAAPAPALTVTSGVSGSVGYNGVKEKTVNTLDGTYAPTSASVYQTANGSFSLAPWAQFAFANGLTLKYTQGYQHGLNYNGSDANETLFNTTYTNGGLTLYNNTLFDNGDYANRIGGDLTAATLNVENGVKFSSDNVSGELKFRRLISSPAVPAYATFFMMYQDIVVNQSLRQAVFTIKNIADTATIQVGDMLNYHFIRMMGIGSNDFTSFSEVGRLAHGAIGTGSFVNVDTTFDFTKTLGLPLTFKWFSYVPMTSVIMPDYLAGTRNGSNNGNFAFDVGYTLDKVGAFDVGFSPTFDYTTNIAITGPATAPTSTALGKGLSNGLLAAAADRVLAPSPATLMSDTAPTTFWLDANLSLVPNLALQVGLDGKMGTYADASTAASALAGTTIAFTKLDPVAYADYNFGVEANYDLKDMVKGLTVGGNFYYEMVTGQDYKKQFNATYVADTTKFQGASYTADSAAAFDLGFLPGIQLGVSATYAFSDVLSFTASNTYTSAVSDYQRTWTNIDLTKATYAGDLLNWAPLSGKDAQGFYGSNAIKLGTSYVAGKATLGFTLGYTMYTGLPTASDLHVTGATTAQNTAADAAYAAFISSNFNPWSAAFSYAIAF